MEVDDPRPLSSTSIPPDPAAAVQVDQTGTSCTDEATAMNGAAKDVPPGHTIPILANDLRCFDELVKKTEELRQEEVKHDDRIGYVRDGSVPISPTRIRPRGTRQSSEPLPNLEGRRLRKRTTTPDYRLIRKPLKGSKVRIQVPKSAQLSPVMEHGG